MAKNTGIEFEKDIMDCCRGNAATPEAHSAYENIISEFGSVSGLKHSSEVKLKCNPKADLLFEDGRAGISVKKQGTIQLASGGLNYNSNSFKLCYEEVKELLTPSEDYIVLDLLAKFPKENLYIPNPEWDSWRSSTGQIIDDALKNVWDNVPLFREAVVDEMLSGRRLYKDKPRAIADYILTPTKISKIDKNYVTNASPHVKIRIAAKGRWKQKVRHREVSVRFDYKT